MLSLIFCPTHSTDDDALISLELIANASDCQHTYINASYINVSFESDSNHWDCYVHPQ